MQSSGTYCAPSASQLELDDLLDELQDVGAENADFFQELFQQLEQAWLQAAAAQLRQQQQRSQWERQWTAQFDHMRKLLENLNQQLPDKTPADAAPDPAVAGLAPATSTTVSRPAPLQAGRRRAPRERFR